MDTSRFSRPWALVAVVCISLALSPSASAQEPCSSVELGFDISETPAGKILSVQYTVAGAPAVKECIIRLEVVLKEGKSIGIKAERVKISGGVMQIEIPIPSVSVFDIDTSLTGTLPPPRPAFAVGAAGFFAVEPRQSIPSLGEQKALGLTLKVAVPMRRALELGAEVAWPAQRAQDSELFAASSERRYLKDLLVSGLIGHEFATGRRKAGLEAIVPKVGLGIARLQTERVRYTIVNNVVRSVTDEQSATSPIFTGGIDARFHLWHRLHVVFGYRFHALLTASDDGTRGRWLQRPEIGFQWSGKENR